MKRSRDTIVSQILEICRDGASKTKIVYQGNLNFRTVNPYLDLLTGKGMIITNDGKPKIYKTTTHGLKMLEHFKYIQDEFLGS